MKTCFLIVGLAAGMAANLNAGETLRLKLEPERDYVLSGSPQELTVKIDLTAGAKKHKRTPLNLAVILDRSGSMSGAKIEKARQAAMGLVDQLFPGDIFSLVTYSDSTEVVLRAQEVEDKEALKRRISRIQSGGSTALYAGVQSGAEQIARHFSDKRINRIILLSDGLANVGPSSPRELRNLGRSLSEKGIAVTTIGVGDDYNEELMAGLAEASDANYYYVKDTEKLPEIFAKELGELLTVAARDVKIEIICPEGVRPIGLIGRPERFENQKAQVRLSHLTMAQNRYVFLRCRVEKEKPEIALVNMTYRDELNGGSEETVSDTARIRFTNDRDRAASSLKSEVVAQKELLLAAIAKDEALAEADAGRYQQAAQKLSQQAVVLDNQYRNAPASLQPTLRLEIDNLRQQANDLENNRYGAGMRKALQNEAWMGRNSKSYSSGSNH
ncbi:MAG TPA: VWA domain-containing protein [Clostridia bacterium]|nr:VWA domain-containing protein [Clostridia bacterium]